MINRILIRIKVVQMLYSYLLTRRDFTLEKAPETASKDKRFAYKLYLDLISSGFKLVEIHIGLLFLDLSLNSKNIYSTVILLNNGSVPKSSIISISQLVKTSISLISLKAYLRRISNNLPAVIYTTLKPFFFSSE